MSTKGVFIARSDKFTLSFDFELENGECIIVYVLLISANVQPTPGSDADEGFKISGQGLGFIHVNVCSVRAEIDTIPIFCPKTPTISIVTLNAGQIALILKYLCLLIGDCLSFNPQVQPFKEA